MTSHAEQPLLTFIIGCTGCGKGALGRQLAQWTGGEIISIDSMKVYRRMDVGTAKPSMETRRLVPHHLIDVVEPWEEFSVARYVTLAEEVIQEVASRDRPIFVVGGTPLYVKALLEGLFEGPSASPEIRKRLHDEARTAGMALLYDRLRQVDPTAVLRIHPNDLRRIVRALEVYESTGMPISALQSQWDRGRVRHRRLIIGLRRERTEQASRTNQRVLHMMAAGLLDEVRSLLAEPQPLSDTARKAVGYAELIEHLEGRCTLDEAVEQIKINTRGLAKAQRTWFKRLIAAAPLSGESSDSPGDPHEGAFWINLTPHDTVEGVAQRLMQQRGAAWSP